MQEESLTLPKVSVIIPNYNYGYFLRQAIESVLSQTYSNIEVIVVDDGSTDETWEVLAKFPQVKVLRQNREGVSVARNRGVAAASGVYLAFLDSDDLWAPQKVEKQVQKFLSNPDLGAVTVGTTHIDREGHPLKTDLHGEEGYLAEKILLFHRPNIHLSGIMITKQAFDRVGGFDPHLSTAADLDLAFRIAYYYPYAHIPEPLCYYRHHTANMHLKLSLFEHDMPVFFEKALSYPPYGKLRRKVYGLYYRVLAGEYWKNRSYGKMAKFLVLSMMKDHTNMAYYINKMREKLSPQGSMEL